MPPKRAQNKSHEESTPAPEQFWDETSSVEEHRQKVSDHIARLQQRQMELVQQTTHELEELKHQLDTGNALEEHVSRARQPLLTEIATLRSTLAKLESEKVGLESELTKVQADYQSHYAQMQGALASLKNIIRSQARAFDQQVRVFSLDATQTLEGMLNSVESAAVPLPDTTKSAPITRTDATSIAHSMEELLREFPIPEVPTRPAPALAHAVQPEPKAKKASKPRRWSVKKMAVRTVAAALVVSVGWGGVKMVQGLSGEGEVAGAATTTSSQSTATAVGDNPTEKYKESYAIVPFDQTEWETQTDSEFGFSVRYPKNTSNRVKTIGGSNVWFLRFDSYLMKITREETRDTLEQWWEKSRAFYELDSTVEKGVFKNRPAWIITPTIPAKHSGTTYIFATKTGVMQVWVKDEDPETDDGKRITRMVESLTILNQ
jgi:hypothetical protein